MLVYWIWLSCRCGMDDRAKKELVRHFQTPEQIYMLERRQLRDMTHLSPKAIESLLDKDLAQATQIIKLCGQKQINMVAYSDSTYPAPLRALADAPLVLYYLGNLPQLQLQPVIGVVGTRKFSVYGARVAVQISGQIAAGGGLVVTGGAKGIDTCALEGALAQGKPTMVFHAGGLDKLYPSENAGLFRRVLETGCIASEYPPGTRCFPGNFLRRNRLISGISDGVLVVEAPQSSGALNTAHWAVEQGRDVFAVPGPVDIPSCKGSNALIGDIARPALDGWMVLKEYLYRYPNGIKQVDAVQMNMETVQPAPEKPDLPKPKTDKITVDKRGDCPYSVVEKDFSAFDERERAVLAKLTDQPVPVDGVLEGLPCSPAEGFSVLTKLTLKGVVQTHPGNLISLKHQ